MSDAGRIAAWCDALVARHTRDLQTPELLKAIRALSARYVERRSELTRRTPTDSAGKRAAFAAFFAPLHLVTAHAVARQLRLGCDLPITRIVDLGCGTGAAAAGCALALPAPVSLLGVDRQGWSLAEARWNWRQLGLAGRTERDDLVDAAGRLAPSAHSRAHARTSASAATLVVLGWSVNELASDERDRLLASLRKLPVESTSLLVIEPIAGSATPWWEDWAAALAEQGARADMWRLDVALPDQLRALDEAAGFRRDALTAKTIHRPAGIAKHRTAVPE